MAQFCDNEEESRSSCIHAIEYRFRWIQNFLVDSHAHLLNSQKKGEGICSSTSP